ncbi:hypothetical protein Hdeb2414_s0064g00765651 [Helianthus debilis subsp. tardiflorus]
MFLIKTNKHQNTHTYVCVWSTFTQSQEKGSFQNPKLSKIHQNLREIELEIRALTKFMINHARRSQVDSKQARWELGKERVKRIMDAKNVCANAR